MNTTTIRPPWIRLVTGFALAVTIATGTFALALPPRTTARWATWMAAPGPVLSAWALWTRRTGTITGSANADTWTTSTESMIKPWIVADFLRRLGSRQPTAAQLADATRAIVNSDDDAAQRLYLADGQDAVIGRLVRVCGLAHTSIGLRGWWSYTDLTATDAVRFGRCLADGRAAGPTWTAWVLKQMRLVRGTVAEHTNGGRWGIIDALPEQIRNRVSIKNGWTLINADQMWHLNCLAVADRWVLAVLTRYPAALGKEYGDRMCRAVTARVLGPMLQ